MRWMLLAVLVMGCELDAANLDNVAPAAVSAPDAQVPTVDAGAAADVVEAAAIVAPSSFPRCGDIPGGLLGGTEVCTSGMDWLCMTACQGPHGDVLRDIGMESCTTHQNPSYSDVVETICVHDCSQCPPRR